MNTMKTLLIAPILALTILLSGCALMDGLMGIQEVQALNEDGEPLFFAPDGSKTTEAVDTATGQPNKPVTRRAATGEAPIAAAKDWLSLLGPWGALAGTVIAGAAGVYTRIRTGQSSAQTEAAESASRFLIVLIEKIKTGVADVFTDGKLDSDKLRAWLKDQGRQFSDPKYLDEMVQKVTKGL